jgi:hypothetical protein
MLTRAALVAVVAAVAVPPAAQAENLTIQLTSVVIKVTAVDRKPKGTSKGDRVIQRNKLFNAVKQFGKTRGARVGTDQGTIVFTSAHTERYDGVTHLPGGTIRVKGPVKLLLDGAIRIPVVGGTGRFAKAKGMLYVGSGEEKVLNVYELTLPGVTGRS